MGRPTPSTSNGSHPHQSSPARLPSTKLSRDGSRDGPYVVDTLAALRSPATCIQESNVIANAIVSALAGVLTAYIVALICSPFVILFCLGLREEYSVSFWVRTVILSQILFWGSFVLNAPTYGYGNMDLVAALFNFVMSVPATALMMRSWLRFRKNKGEDGPDPKDRLDEVFAHTKTVRKWGTKAGKALIK